MTLKLLRVVSVVFSVFICTTGQNSLSAASPNEPSACPTERYILKIEERAQDLHDVYYTTADFITMIQEKKAGPKAQQAIYSELRDTLAALLGDQDRDKARLAHLSPITEKLMALIAITAGEQRHEICARMDNTPRASLHIIEDLETLKSIANTGRRRDIWLLLQTEPTPSHLRARHS